MNLLSYSSLMERNIEKGNRIDTMQRQGCEIHHGRDAYEDYEPMMKANRQPVGMHHHTFYEIFLFLSGDIDYLIESRLYHMRPGDLLLIRPLQMHQPVFVPAKGFYERIVLWIEPSMMASLSTHQEDLSACFAEEPMIRLNAQQKEKLQLYLNELVKVTHKEPLYPNIRERALLSLILTEINEAVRMDHPTASFTEDYLSSYTESAVKYIASHLNDPLQVRSIARICHVSEQYLLKVFRQDMGITLHQYINQKRILTARQYMSSGMNSSEAAERCGFDNYTTFWREYRREYGVSPSKYRSDLK